MNDPSARQSLFWAAHKPFRVTPKIHTIIQVKKRRSKTDVSSIASTGEAKSYATFRPFVGLHPKWSVKILLSAFFFFASLAVPILACAQGQTEREVVVLAINDVYRIEGVEGGQRGGMSLVRALRAQLEQQHHDLLFLHAGDFLFPSLLSKWTSGAHMIEMMNALDGAL
jgi:hypothetical protein